MKILPCLMLSLSLVWLAGCGGSSGTQKAAVVGWTIGHGGTVHVEGKTLQVKKLTDMPGGNFVIEKIDLTERNLTDRDLENLSILGELQSLSLHGTKVSDEGLLFLSAIRNLKELDLSKTNVTDQGLKTLAEFPALEKLHLHNTFVTNEGLKEFQASRPGCQTFPSKK